MFKMMWACGFVLVLLFPQFLSIREIDFSETVDIDIENELFPRSPDYCGKEDSVNLSNMQLSEIPPDVIISDKIRHVNLSFNRLSKISDSFFHDVSNIKCLNLTANYYSPRKVLDGTNSDSLKTLVLDKAGWEDRYDTDPCTMTGYFPNLETLHLNEIRKCVIDNSFEVKLPRLETLYLKDYDSDRRLEYDYREENYDSSGKGYKWRLPSTVRHLHLEGTKFDEYTVDTVSNLQSLYLDRYNYADMFYIPYSTNLEVLTCRNCSLNQSAIVRFFESPRNALRLFDLSHNELSELPNNTFQQASNLEILILSNNEFAIFPDVQTLSHLRGLVLSHNRIRQLADIKSNSLKVLGLRGNGISRIYNTTFQGLPALEMLDLSENKLTSLPNNWTRSLRNLLTLNLNSNLFTTLANTSLTMDSSGLRHLFMKGNLIERFDEQDFQFLPENCTIYFMLINKPYVQHETFTGISVPST